MLGKLFKNQLEAAANKFSGRTDFLEAVCAASALIAAADGDIEDSEVESTISTIKANSNLSSFSGNQIEQTLEKMFERTKNRTGRAGLWSEIEDIKKDPDMCETVYLCALDVSESDGEIEPEEKVVLRKLATTLGLNPAKYDV